MFGLVNIINVTFRSLLVLLIQHITLGASIHILCQQCGVGKSHLIILIMLHAR